MARAGIVRWLRVILPLAALAILSTLFLLSRRPDPDGAIPYVEGAGAETHTPGISGPRFSTVAADGAVVTFSAARAALGQGDGGVEAQQPSLDWQSRDGLRVTLNAGTGRQEGERIALEGGVDMALSSGWRLTAPRVDVDTAASRLSAAGPLSITAPFGTLDAGGMVLTRDAAGAQVLELNHGVRLLYRPMPDAAPPAPTPETESR